MNEIWIATSNRGKLGEFKTLLHGFDIHSQSELNVYSAPDETGQTFEDNARIKARSLRAMKPNLWIIGEDSGLEVEGLKNMPGVHSARYAGPKATDAENVAKILKMMSIRSAQHREARFRSVVVAYSPTGEEYVVNGELKGRIATVSRGKEGFGYDSIFIPNGQEKTLAELGLTFKNKISHRAEAIRRLNEVLK